jgi:hypothetical protein
MKASVHDSLLPVPEIFTLTENTGELMIEKKWFSLKDVLLFIFSLIWNGMLMFFYSAMLMGQVPGVFFLFPILHVAAGSWMLYASLCGFFNKTIIRIDMQQVSVRHTPLPWTGQRTIDRRDVRQLYIVQQVRSNKGTTTITYDVQLITKSNKAISLIKGLQQLTEARFIEQKMESFLRIENVPVTGEMAS